MNDQEQLKLQAYLDGELPEAEAREVIDWLARDAAAAALLAELRNTRQGLAGFEAGVRLPESREFFWGKIQREIERLEGAAPDPEPALPLIARLRRLLIPATAVAALAVAGLLALRPGASAGPLFETALADAGSMTYRDDAAGATLVWFSYPPDNEVSQADEGTLE